MTEQILTLQIKECWIQQGQKKDYWMIDTDQGTFNCFDETLGQDIANASGKVLECRIKVNGRWKTIISADLPEADNRKAPRVATPANLPDNRQSSIEAQCILKCAIEHWNHRDLKTQEERQEFTDLVVFLHTILNGVKK